MNKYFAFFKIRFVNSIQYRAPVFFAVLALVIWGLMKVLLFCALYAGTSSIDVSMNFEAVRAYVWLEGILLPLFGIWMLESDIAKSIINGDIGYALIKPTTLYWVWFARSLAFRLSKTLIRCGPVILVAVLLPPPYNLPAPASLNSLIYFLISTILATLLLVSLSMFVYLITCRTLAFSGIKAIAVTITTFLTGGVIPLPFFPDSFVAYLKVTPFAYVQNVAFRIYSGHLSGTEMLYAVGGQVMWVVVMILAGKKFSEQICQKIVMQGG